MTKKMDENKENVSKEKIPLDTPTPELPENEDSSPNPKKATKAKKTKEHPEAYGTRIISKLADVILFGGLVPNEARATGCIHASIAKSYHDIHIEMLKVSSPFTSTDTKKTGSLGRKYFIPYALYGGSYIYSPQRNTSFKEFGSTGMTEELFTLFEESLIHASMNGRSAVKGFIEPVLIVKVVKSPTVKNRYDDLQSDIRAKVVNTPVLSDMDVKLETQELKRQLLANTARGDYERIEVFSSRSGIRKHKGIYELAERYPEFSFQPSDLASAIEYVVIYEVKQSNPNGDPEMDNMPRRLASTQRGIITGERQKRWVRDYIESKGHLIFGSRKSSLEKSKDRFAQMCKVLED